MISKLSGAFSTSGRSSSEATMLMQSAGQIVEDARQAVASVDGVESAHVELTFDPPWTPERSSPLIRSSLGL